MEIASAIQYHSIRLSLPSSPFEINVNVCCQLFFICDYDELNTSRGRNLIKRLKVKYFTCTVNATQRFVR